VAAAEGVARSYAKAVFALAQERGQAETVARELDLAADLFAREPELGAFLSRPWVTAAAKRDVAAEVAARLEVVPLTRDALALVAAHGRAEHLRSIAAAYRELADAAAGRVRARVRTAAPLTDGERAGLAGRLSRVVGGRQVVLEEVVDPALLGGFVAEIGSLRVDGSLDGQLARLRERLVRG
jgi:F-type H+-transporting ATPase subunit delta